MLIDQLEQKQSLQQVLMHFSVGFLFRGFFWSILINGCNKKNSAWPALQNGYILLLMCPVGYRRH